MCIAVSQVGAEFSSYLKCERNLFNVAASSRCWSASKTGEASLVYVGEAGQVFMNIDDFMPFFVYRIDFGWHEQEFLMLPILSPVTSL